MGKSLALKIGIVAAVAALAVAAFVARGMRRSGDAEDAGGTVSSAGALPRLVDLGSKTCIPCKMMQPILEELRREFDGRLSVEFIDIKANPEAGRGLGISVIPTQIWYDESGEEIARHEGFIPKEDILAVFREHGVELGGEAAPSPPDAVR